jgi:hypothetical protein
VHRVQDNYCRATTPPPGGCPSRSFWLDLKSPRLFLGQAAVHDDLLKRALADALPCASARHDALAEYQPGGNMLLKTRWASSSRLRAFTLLASLATGALQIAL